MPIKEKIQKVSGELQILYMAKKTISSPVTPGRFGLAWTGVQYSQLPIGQWDRYLEFVSAAGIPRGRLVRLKGTIIPKKVRKGSRYGARGIYTAYEGLERLQEEKQIYINGALGKIELDLQTMLGNLSILERRYATQMQNLKMKKENELRRVEQEAELAKSQAIQLQLEKELAVESNQVSLVLKKSNEEAQAQERLNAATVMVERVKLDLEVANQEEIKAIRTSDIAALRSNKVIVRPLTGEIKSIVSTTLQRPANLNRIESNLNMMNAAVLPMRFKLDIEQALKNKAKELSPKEEREVLTTAIKIKSANKPPGKIGLPVAAAAGVLIFFLNR